MATVATVATVARGHPLDDLLATFEAMSMEDVIELADILPMTITQLAEMNRYGFGMCNRKAAAYMNRLVKKQTMSPGSQVLELEAGSRTYACVEGDKNEVFQFEKKLVARDRLRLKLERRKAGNDGV